VTLDEAEEAGLLAAALSQAEYVLVELAKVTDDRIGVGLAHEISEAGATVVGGGDVVATPAIAAAAMTYTRDLIAARLVELGVSLG
jgi:hypothetical protein